MPVSRSCVETIENPILVYRKWHTLVALAYALWDDVTCPHRSREHDHSYVFELKLFWVSDVRESAIMIGSRYFFEFLFLLEIEQYKRVCGSRCTHHHCQRLLQGML